MKLSRTRRPYIAHARPTDSDSLMLFMGSRRRGGNYEGMTRRSVQLMMRRLSDITGIHIHPTSSGTPSRPARSRPAWT